VDDLLEMLASASFVSGEDASRRMGMTRAAVWKRINQLRSQGYDIQSAGKKGYHLVPPADSLIPVFLKKGLDTNWAGQPQMLYERQMTSTNIVLRQAAEEGAPHGTLALCEEQTHGKGRRGRTWVSPAGQGIWMSLLLRPQLPPAKAQLITLAAALAMCQAVERETGLAPQIKWPNDLVLGGKKICGILLELSGDLDKISYVIVGTGLNVGKDAYPPELSGQAASLAEVAGGQVKRAPIIHAYLRSMELCTERLEKEGLPGIFSEYEKRSCTLGSKVHVMGAGVDFAGIAVSMDDMGALLVKDNEGTIRTVLAGDVSVRGVMGYV